MRIGVLVGRDEKGGLDYLGKPGPIDALDQLQREITDNGGKLGKKVYVKTYLADASRSPLKAKKVGGAGRPEEEPEAEASE